MTTPSETNTIVLEDGVLKLTRGVQIVEQQYSRYITYFKMKQYTMTYRHVHNLQMKIQLQIQIQDLLTMIDSRVEELKNLQLKFTDTMTRNHKHWAVKKP